jgi:hypothetical protein
MRALEQRPDLATEELLLFSLRHPDRSASGSSCGWPVAAARAFPLRQRQLTYPGEQARRAAQVAQSLQSLQYRRNVWIAAGLCFEGDARALAGARTRRLRQKRQARYTASCRQPQQDRGLAEPRGRCAAIT